MANLAAFGPKVTGPITWHPPTAPIVVPALDPDKVEKATEAKDNNLRTGFLNLTAGDDLFNFPSEQKALFVNAMNGNDHIQTGSGDDVIHGGAGIDTIEAGDGSNTVWGGADNDTIRSGTGDDTLNGGSGKDTIFGGLGTDTISGGSGDDTLWGDLVYVQAGQRDTLNGGSGADQLVGGGGGDLLTGGKGADKFQFALATDSVIGARDSVRDFNHAEGDRIDFSGLLAKPTDALHTPLKFVNGPSTAANTVWVAASATGHETVLVNLDGGQADMSIDVVTSTHLTRGDFIL